MKYVDNVQQLINQLTKMASKAQAEKNMDVTVGYTQEYAIYVHEDLTANHPNGGQAKYLEQPAKQLRPELTKIIKNALAKGVSYAQALLLAGYRLLRESQKLVPVDTGALRASGFCSLTSKASQASSKAYKSSQKFKKKKGK